MFVFCPVLSFTHKFSRPLGRQIAAKKECLVLPLLFSIKITIIAELFDQLAGPLMDLDWTEKARQHSAGRSAHDLSQKIATPSIGDNRS